MAVNFDPQEFLQLATHLTSTSPAEREFRTATGRAYYALFLIAREELKITKKQGTHDAVINEVRRRNKAVGDQLAKLQRLRESADYELQSIDHQNRDWAWKWGQAKNLAQFLQSRLKHLPPPRPHS